MMMIKHNTDIRTTAKQNGVYLYEIAEKLGVSEPTFNRWLRKELSAELGVARLSFGKPEDMERLLDLTPGSVSIMGLMNDADNQVQLLIDEDVLKDPYIGCHPCINTSSLKIATPDILEKYLPAVHHKPITVHLENHIEEATEHKED